VKYNLLYLLYLVEHEAVGSSSQGNADGHRGNESNPGVGTLSYRTVFYKTGAFYHQIIHIVYYFCILYLFAIKVCCRNAVAVAVTEF